MENWILIIIIAIGVFCTLKVAEKQNAKKQKQLIDSYEKSEYFLQTHIPYRMMISDRGRLGEYLIYSDLKLLCDYKRFLFNLYVQKPNGETTEIDVVMLHETGIYVFESKNFSGWIFGNENHMYWTQSLSLSRGRTEKHRFFNPIKQNMGHVKWLSAFLNDPSLSFYPFVVFGDDCTLKDVTLTQSEQRVVCLNSLFQSVKSCFDDSTPRMPKEKIDELYDKLYPLTQADDAAKQNHIDNINQIYGQPSAYPEYQDASNF